MQTIITVATVITLLGWLSTPGAWAQPGGQPGTTTEQQPKVWYASTLLGADVKNPQGETLGEIAELLIDPKEARITMVVISVGGFLGLGAKSVAVPGVR